MDPLDPHDARMRIQIEYLEMPTLRLTLAQVGRLCGLPRDACDAAVSSLVETGFLSKSDGSYLRCGLDRQADAVVGPRSLAAPV